MYFDKLQYANELGDVMDEIFGTDNIKRKGAGAIGLRDTQPTLAQFGISSSTILALIPFVNPGAFFPPSSSRESPYKEF
ncbi:DUF84 family protein [Vibrio lentus]|nr:DUF84 family protein [Vibrio lentus]